jgi:hypothetical protein
MSLDSAPGVTEGAIPEVAPGGRVAVAVGVLWAVVADGDGSLVAVFPMDPEVFDPLEHPAAESNKSAVNRTNHVLRRIRFIDAPSGHSKS